MSIGILFFPLVSIHLLFVLFHFSAPTFSTAFDVEINLEPVHRIFQPAQLINLTLNKAAEALTPLQCAGSTIAYEHVSKCTKSKNAMYIIPHVAIRHEGVRCGTGSSDEYLIIVPGEQLSDARTAFINNLGPLYTIMSSNARANNAFSVLQGVDPVYVGFEYEAPRICGGVERFPQNTIFFFIVPSPDDRDLNFGFAYLGVNEVGVISVRDDEEICLYKQTRNLGPGQPAFATPTPSASPGRDLSMPPDMYDLNDPEDIGACFPVSTAEPYVPPSEQPSPFGSSSPVPTLSDVATRTPTPSTSVTPSPTESSQEGGPSTPSASVTPSAVPTPSTGTDSTESLSPSGSPNPTEIPDPGGVCFPSSARVELDNGLVIQISQLHVGDRVHVGEGKYSDVFLFTHRNERVYSTFVNLTVESNASIALSPSHYIPVSGRLRAAHTLIKGDVVMLGNGKLDAIVTVERAFMRGLYNPQTIDGHIVVNGIIASTYTQTVDPATATSLLAPLRWIHSLHMMGPLLSRVFIDGSDFLATWLPSGRAIHV